MRGMWISLCIVLLPGCSYIFVTGPPPVEQRHSDLVADCSTGTFLPFLDMGIGGYQIFRTAVAVGASDHEYAAAPISREADVAFGIGLSALFVASAIYGFGETSACSDYIAGPTRREEIRHKRSRAPAIEPRTAPSSVPPANVGVGCDYDAQCAGTQVCNLGRCKAHGKRP